MYFVTLNKKEKEKILKKKNKKGKNEKDTKR